MIKEKLSKDGLQSLVNKVNVEMQKIYALKGAKIGVARDYNALVLISISNVNQNEIDNAPTFKSKLLTEKFAIGNVINETLKTEALKDMKFICKCAEYHKLKEEFKNVELYK